MTFKEWMDEVDNMIAEISGLSSECIADAPYRDWYDAGEPAEDAAEFALEAAGYNDAVTYYR